MSEQVLRILNNVVQNVQEARFEKRVGENGIGYVVNSVQTLEILYLVSKAK